MTGPALDPRRRRALEARTRAVAAVNVAPPAHSSSRPVAQRSPIVETTARPATSAPAPSSSPASTAPGVHRRRVGRDAEEATAAMWVSRAEVRRARRRRILRRVGLTLLVAAATIVFLVAGAAWLAYGLVP